jgi:hypothetical protein
MAKSDRKRDHLIPDQVSAGIINTINESRIQDEFLKLSAQDVAFDKANEEINKVREFISKPANILGSEATKHGEIAEQVEVGVRNAKSILQQQETTATFNGVGRTAPEDYLIDGIDVQSKFINGVNNNLSHVLDHMDKYQQFGRDGSFYHIPKDSYEIALKLKNGIPVDDLNSRSQAAIISKISQIEEATGKSFKEVVKPGISEYSEVQTGKVNETLDNHSDNLQDENELLKDNIERDHQASLEEGIQATLAAAAVGASISLGVSLYSKYKEGKNPFKGELSKEDWKEIGISTGKGTVGGAISGGAIYLLTNNAELSAPFAGAIVSAAKGMTSLVSDYNSGKIDFDQFVDSGLLVCSDSAIVGLATAAGQALIPIPILGAVIGSLAGKILADFATGKIAGVAERIQKDMDDFMVTLDDAYQKIIRQINTEFDRLGDLTEAAFDIDNNINLVASSIALAREYGVNEKDIIHSHAELDDFMMG